MVEEVTAESRAQQATNTDNCTATPDNARRQNVLPSFSKQLQMPLSTPRGQRGTVATAAMSSTRALSCHA